MDGVDIPLPSAFWTHYQSLKGTYGKHIISRLVPGTDLTGKWIIISGGNNGIGRYAAHSFAEWGANIILACREPPPWEVHPNATVEECRDIAKAKGHVSEIEYWELDMADLASVEAFAQRWLGTKRPLDILCNNAGTGVGARTETKDGFNMIHQTNFLSHVLLTLTLLPSLLKSSTPRIICTTSCTHHTGTFNLTNLNNPTNPGNAYPTSKLYFQIWLTELQRRFLSSESYQHVTINGVHPGYVRTGIWTSPSSNSSSAPFLSIGYLLTTLVNTFGITAQQGSLAITYAATAPECGPDPATQGVGDSRGKGGGRYFSRIWEAEAMPLCSNADARRLLWEKVDAELGLNAKGLLDGLDGR